MKELLLGVDIGTSACKVAIFTKNGEIIAQGKGEYNVYYPYEGFAEQNPDEWWSTVCNVLKKMLEENNVNPANIEGIGVDGQSGSAILIDRNKKLLCNTPIWLDNRTDEICTRLLKEHDEDSLVKICGNSIRPTYSLPKLIWYKNNIPELYKKTYKVLQSNSYIVYKLTGKFTQDLSQGYGFQCFDMRNGCWDKDLCNSFDISMDILPNIHMCYDIVGKLTKNAAEETGLLEGTPVVAGGLDAACASLGVGVIKKGQTQEQGGQAGGVSICIDKYKYDKRLILGYHVVPNLWLLQGGTVGGGGIVKWLEEEFCVNERNVSYVNGTSSFYEMDKEAEKIPVGSDGVIFLPYMTGERSPIWDTKAKGVYYGLDFSKKRAHIIRASLEGVAFSIKHNLDVAKEAGVEVDILNSMGGAANSKLWTQIKADVTGKEITVYSTDTATTMGASMLAGVGIGMYKSFDEAVKLTKKKSKLYTPNEENYIKYQKIYSRYIGLYKSLEKYMHKEDNN